MKHIKPYKTLFLPLLCLILLSFASAQARMTVMVIGGAAGGATPGLLVDYTGSVTDTFDTANAAWYGGSFVYGSSGTYTITSVKIRCQDDSSDAGNSTLRIYPYYSMSTKPQDGATALATKQVANSALPDAATLYEFTLDSPLTDMVQGYRYYVVLAPDATGSTLVYENAQTSEGDFHTADQGANWIADFTDYSLIMQIYGY